MSDNSNNRSEGRGYNSDVGSYSTPQVSSSLTALAESASPEPLQATRLATRAATSQTPILVASSFRRPNNPRQVFVKLSFPRWILSPGDLSSSLSRGSGFPQTFQPASPPPEVYCCPSWIDQAQGGLSRPMPLHFYSDPRVLKAARISPGSVADPEALEALRATYNESDHVPPPPPATLSSPPTPTGASTSRKRIGLPPSNPWPAQSQRRSDKAPISQVRILSFTLPSCHGPSNLIVFFPSIAPCPRTNGFSVSKKSSADPSHKELISSFSILGIRYASLCLVLPLPNSPTKCSPSQFFDLKGVMLQSYRWLLSSYEGANGSSSHVGQLKQEIKTLKREKAREVGVLQRRLKNLTVEHPAREVCSQHLEAVRAKLEGVQAKSDSAQLEREAFKKEMESLHASRDEALQSNNLLLS
ncbi:hypothetical protein LIER_17550 [Lithospermum erythrorhizon]|uniref:Uncharacterized protein n=1 Tax=Lithospermum erythrorhizon TaxID=34254 RepID=A0AAV3QAU0_LITER